MASEKDAITTTTTTGGTTAPTTAAKVTPAAKNTLLILNCILLSIGHCAGPVMRLYFVHGGHRVWLSSFLETAGFPFIAAVLLLLYLHRRREKKPTNLIHMRPRLFYAAAFIGVLTGFDDYLYAYGVARLPISTIALIIASQLAFTALFAFLLVKQRFTAYSVNAVVLLTVGAGVLALHTSSDRPEGESKAEYVMGFVLTVAAAALYGLILPVIELTYNKAKQRMTYTLVLEIQLVMCFFATIVCTVGMIVNNDFKSQKTQNQTLAALLTSRLRLRPCSNDTASWSVSLRSRSDLASDALSCLLRSRSASLRCSFVSPCRYRGRGNSKGGKGFWTRQNEILHDIVYKWPIVAIFFLGSYWSDFLRVVVIVWDYNCCPTSSDRGVGRTFL